MAATESACIFARTRAIESARAAFADLGLVVLVLAVSAVVAALGATAREPPAPPAVSRHAPTMCTVSLSAPLMCIESERVRLALSAFVPGLIATCATEGFLGTGTDPFAHCAGTVNPGTESRLPSATRAVAERAPFAESTARDARASRASWQATIIAPHTSSARTPKRLTRRPAPRSRPRAWTRDPHRLRCTTTRTRPARSPTA